MQENLQNQIDELKKEIDKLKSSTTIPLDVGEAFRKRLQILSGDTNSTSPKTITVNEAGIDTYAVAKPMTGFIAVKINGQSKLIPYYV